MGCASSAALPFLTTKESQPIPETPRLNGNPPYELKTSLSQNVIESVDDSYISDKMKEVVDSTAVQGVIGGVVQVKDEIYNQVKGAGEAVTEKINTVVSDVEEKIESAFGTLTNAVNTAEEKIKSEVEGVQESVNALFKREKEVADGIKQEDIDDLLEALPTEEEVTKMAETTAEEVVDLAREEVLEETHN